MPKTNFLSWRVKAHLIGTAPCGAVIFVSSLYTSSNSDRDLTGILDLLKLGDGYIAPDMALERSGRDSREFGLEEGMILWLSRSRAGNGDGGRAGEQVS